MLNLLTRNGTTEEIPRIEDTAPLPVLQEATTRRSILAYVPALIFVAVIATGVVGAFAYHAPEPARSPVIDDPVDPVKVTPTRVPKTIQPTGIPGRRPRVTQWPNYESPSVTTLTHSSTTEPEPTKTRQESTTEPAPEKTSEKSTAEPVSDLVESHGDPTTLPPPTSTLDEPKIARS